MPPLQTHQPVSLALEEGQRGRTRDGGKTEDFNSMIQQEYQFPQMAGWVLLVYIGGE